MRARMMLGSPYSQSSIALYRGEKRASTEAIHSFNMQQPQYGYHASHIHTFQVQVYVAHYVGIISLSWRVDEGLMAISLLRHLVAVTHEYINFEGQPPFSNFVGDVIRSPGMERKYQDHVFARRDRRT